MVRLKVQTGKCVVGSRLDLRSVPSTVAMSSFLFAPFNMWFSGQPETRAKFSHRNWDTVSLTLYFLILISLSGSSGCYVFPALFPQPVSQRAFCQHLNCSYTTVTMTEAASGQNCRKMRNSICLMALPNFWLFSKIYQSYSISRTLR